MTEIGFRLTVQTEEGTLYFQSMPPMPVPRVGDEIFVPGDGMGWWRVVAVSWALPSIGAMTPTMHVTLNVEWSPNSTTPAPVYDEDRGWVCECPLPPHPIRPRRQRMGGVVDE